MPVFRLCAFAGLGPLELALFLPIEQHPGKHDNSLGAAIDVVLQLHFDAVPAGQRRNHEKPYAPIAEQFIDIDLAGFSKQAVHPLLVGGQHAQAAILNVDGKAGGNLLPPQQHLSVRRGELGGVLDELSDEVDDVRNGVPAQDTLNRGHDLDPRILLDLGNGGAQHLVHGYLPGPLAPRHGTAEYSQALRLAAHTGGEVIDGEQPLEKVRVLDLGLQIVEQLDFPVNQ